MVGDDERERMRELDEEMRNEKRSRICEDDPSHFIVG